MAAKFNSMFRISQLAKDFGLKPKEVTSRLEEVGISGKSNSATLEPDGVNLLFEKMTVGAHIKNIDAYLTGKTKITLPPSSDDSDKVKEKEEAEAENMAAEAAKKMAEIEAEAKRKAEEEAAKRKAEEEAAKRKAEEEAAKRKAEEEAAKRKAEEEAAKRKAEEEARIEREAKEAERVAAEKAEEEKKRAEEEAAKLEADKIAEQKTSSEKNSRVKSTEGNQGQNMQSSKDSNQNSRGEREIRGDYRKDNNSDNNRSFSGERQRADRNDNRGDGNFRRNDRQFGDKSAQDRRPADRQQNGFGQKDDGKSFGRDGRKGDFKQNNRSSDRSSGGAGDRFRDKDSGNDRAPIPPQPKPKIEHGIERKRTGVTRVVDTRTTSVDLSKYDERLESFSPEVDDSHSTKQKIKKQNNNRDQKGTGKKSDKERIAMEKLRKANLEKAKKQPLKVTIPDEITVGELAQRLKVTAAECVKKLMLMGVMATVNQVIDYDTAYLIADEFGAIVTREVTVTIEEKLFSEEPASEEELEIRAPIVCVMGHVDHGKTSILDAIRHTNVTSGEAGGITQHIGAYRVNVDGKDITFLDTPGHEAFTAMRARGAQCTDIAILVVAGDDGIMPQTVEAINHAKAAGVDIIVAINKMDKPHANAENVKTELTKYDLVPEEWGGDIMCVPVSALTKMGIKDLLEDILLIAEVKEYKANPHKRAKGVVIEAKLDKGRGPVATVLVQDGTLKSGDIVIAGTSVGRVRAMTNDRGQQLEEAGPSVPVEITGLSEVPLAGDEFNAVEDERMARELADQRREKAKEEQFRLSAKVSLDDLFSQIAAGVKELNIIVKADVGGSAEAVKTSLEKISNDEVRVRVIHSAVGGITESDVMFAAASNAIIVGFNVRPDKGAIDSAERQNVDIRTYRIIYECIEEIKAAMKGLLAPTYKEVLQGHIEVRQTIKVPGVGIVAGSYVLDGKVTRQSQIRIVRDGIVIMEDKISSLRRFKDDVREVAAGYECGIGLDRCLDIRIGDILEAYIMEEVEK